MRLDILTLVGLATFLMGSNMGGCSVGGIGGFGGGGGGAWPKSYTDDSGAPVRRTSSGTRLGELDDQQETEVAYSLVDDADFDGIPDDIDNCLGFHNPLQRMTRGDGRGNHCMFDMDNDGQVGFADIGMIQNAFGEYEPQTTVDDWRKYFTDGADDTPFNFNTGDSIVGVADVLRATLFFGLPPQPSGLPCAVTHIPGDDVWPFCFAPEIDYDGDFISNGDNCTMIANGAVQDLPFCHYNADPHPFGESWSLCVGNQFDDDNDGYGDACDCDADNDGDCDSADFQMFLDCEPGGPSSSDPICVSLDMNKDGRNDSLDRVLRSKHMDRVGPRPGPSDLHP